MILECAIYGNAVYIIRDDWKNLSRLSKREFGVDLDQIRRAYEASFNAENGFRRNRYRLNRALDDSSDAAFRVSQLNLAGEERWDARKRGMLLSGIGAINVALCRETYTVEEARVSASRAALLASLLRCGRSGRLATYRFVPQRAADLPAASKGAMPY